jgi:hypothetical protein
MCDTLSLHDALPICRYVTQGRCPEHDIILEWDVRLKIGSITKGELACPSCKTVLLRTHRGSNLVRVRRVPERVAA